jgi:flagellar protein FlaH
MSSTAILDEEEEVQKKIISTGQGEIDKKLGGGIPVGSLVLIEGQSDSGKSVFCQQLIWGSLRKNVKVGVFTTENTVKSLNSQMASLGLSVVDYILLGWLRIYPMKSSLVKENPQKTVDIILETMTNATECDLFIVDSLTSIISGAGGEVTLAYFERCKIICDKGKTVVNVTHTYAFEQDFLVRLRSISDAHIRLTIEKIGDKLVKSLEVAKIRGAAQSTGNILAFDVEPEIGMKIMPMSRAKA